ncbi:hypothetical protein J2Z62_000334 [Mycoplasmoides fastidiosum]|uniref:Uncharacterized protein n=1 Tax=Mycoplasmoides fastidiosum TaxID=92758 RepID=A0ABU0LYW4_9BACT|nr:hypothetical protein [Mycoplasmoides fastidiosum]MDQ0513896.1 hypothetical protein [Mycoplasmoides fastidiosum]UUD37690.1 hypothetical protein NPA10_03925 [Mycoplasmoides fastidiosum]
MFNSKPKSTELILVRPIQGLYLNMNQVPYKFSWPKLKWVDQSLDFFYVDYYATTYRSYRADYLFLNLTNPERTNKTLAIFLSPQVAFSQLAQVVAHSTFDRAVIRINHYSDHLLNQLSQAMKLLDEKKIKDVVIDLYDTADAINYLHELYARFLYPNVNQINLYFDDETTIDQGVLTQKIAAWLANNPDWSVDHNFSVRRTNYINPYLRFLNGHDNYLGIGDNAVSLIDNLFFKSVYLPKENAFGTYQLYGTNQAEYKEAIINRLILSLLETSINLIDATENWLDAFFGPGNYQLATLRTKVARTTKKNQQIDQIVSVLIDDLQIEPNWFAQINNQNKIDHIINFINSFY